MLHERDARYEVRMPLIETNGEARIFNPVSMEDRSGQDEDLLENRSIEAAVFPMVLKHIEVKNIERRRRNRELTHYGQDQRVVVVYKSKVVVAKHPPVLNLYSHRI